MKALITAILLLSASAAQAQADTILMQLPWKSEQKVTLNLKFAETIEVKAWDKKEVSLQAIVNINAGTLNDAHVIDSIINDRQLVIDADLDKELTREYNWCGCEEQGNRFTINRGKKAWKQLCVEIQYTVYVPAGADLRLETISGSVKITNMKGAIDAESVSGEVNVMIPSGQKADVHLKTVMGRVSSYPDLTTLHDGLVPVLARKLSGKLNGGGKEISLESVTGNVTLKSQ
jgi:hypothetical protein